MISNKTFSRLVLTLSFILSIAGIGSAGTCGGDVQCGCGDVLVESHTMWYDLNNCGGNGLVIGADGITLDGNGHTIDGAGTNYSSGIHIEPKQDVTIKNCIVKDFCWGIHLRHSDNNIIENNNLSSNIQAGIWLYESNGNTLINNVAFNNNDDGIWICYSNNNTLITNNAYSNGDWGIRVGISTLTNTLTDNTTSYNWGGIMISYSTKNELTNNDVSNNYYEGIDISNSDSNTLINNNVSSNGQHGVQLWYSEYNILKSNTITSNGTGIFFSHDANNNIAKNNNILNNLHYGVYFADGANNNEFSDNIICSNNWLDIRDEDANFGDENSCDRTMNWNDYDTTGCRHSCSAPSQTPVANFYFTPSSSKVGDPVTFTSTSYDPDGGSIQSYLWNIYPEHSAQPYRYTEPLFTHYFSEPGTYFVHHYVVDDEGDNASTGDGVEAANIDRWGLIVVPLEGDECAGTPVSNFKTWLCEGGWREDHIKVLKGCDINCLLNDGIGWLADKAQTDDKALIAFLTHGFNYLGFDWSSGLCLKQRDWW
ncbi:MAG: NosD domain-containing protein, partial [Candidatus Zixiibacteriota bacterium]